MGLTIDGLFGLQQMGDRVALYEDPPEATRLQSLFTPETCHGDEYRFDREDFELSLPPAVPSRETPAVEVKVHDPKVEHISLVHLRISRTLSSASLFIERSPGEITDNAVAKINKILKSQAQRVQLAKEMLAAQALRGVIDVDSTTFPGSQVDITITRAVTPLTVDASWATDTTKIASRVQVWRKAIYEASYYPIDTLLHNLSITEYLLLNTQMKEWLQQTNKGVAAFEAAQFTNMAGIREWMEYWGFYKPTGGSATTFIADKEVFALPPASLRAQLLRYIESYAEIPSHAIGGPGVMAGSGGIVGAIRAPKPGLAQFALPLTGNVPGVELVTVWYGIPLVKIPTSVGRCADVTSTG